MHSLRRSRAHDRDPAHLEALVAQWTTQLARHYEPGFGIMPAADRSENFYRQLWTRDFAHAAGNYFIGSDPQSVEDSLSTLIRHQRDDGAIPLRVEKEYALLKLFPGARRLARPAFIFFQGFLKGQTERPVYTGQDFSFAEDTIPAFLIAAGMLFASSARGESFIAKHLEPLRRACDFISAKIDPEDGLISVPPGNVDWADSIIRGGKLGMLNIPWVRALECMSRVFSSLGAEEEARHFDTLFAQAHTSLMQKLYDSSGAYFRTTEGEDRLDTAASVFGSLFYLQPEECVRVQNTLKERVSRESGLSNFSPPYTQDAIMWEYKVIKHQGYHNEYVWPWIKCQNIRVKIKIAEAHPDRVMRARFRDEAVADLYDAAALFEEADGAYEVFFPATRRPAITRWYHPPRNFMANLGAFLGASRELRRLGWIS